MGFAIKSAVMTSAPLLKSRMLYGALAWNLVLVTAVNILKGNVGLYT